MERHRARGQRAREPTRPRLSVADLLEVYRLRELLEAEAARALIAERALDREIAALRRTLADLRSARRPDHLRESVDRVGDASHDRWVVNKIRALVAWYSKGLDGGSRLRTAVNSAESLDALRDRLTTFFFADTAAA